MNFPTILVISSVELLLYNTVHVISTILTGGDALDILNARVTPVAGRRYTVLEMVAETMGGTIKQKIQNCSIKQLPNCPGREKKKNSNMSINNHNYTTDASNH